MSVRRGPLMRKWTLTRKICLSTNFNTSVWLEGKEKKWKIWQEVTMARQMKAKSAFSPTQWDFQGCIRYSSLVRHLYRTFRHGIMCISESISAWIFFMDGLDSYVCNIIIYNNFVYNYFTLCDVRWYRYEIYLAVCTALVYLNMTQKCWETR